MAHIFKKNFDSLFRTTMRHFGQVKQQILTHCYQIFGHFLHIISMCVDNGETDIFCQKIKHQFMQYANKHSRYIKKGFIVSCYLTLSKKVNKSNKKIETLCSTELIHILRKWILRKCPKFDTNKMNFRQAFTLSLIHI